MIKWCKSYIIPITAQANREREGTSDRMGRCRVLALQLLRAV